MLVRSNGSLDLSPLNLVSHLDLLCRTDGAFGHSLPNTRPDLAKPVF